MGEIAGTHHIDPLQRAPTVQVLARELLARGHTETRVKVEVRDELQNGSLSSSDVETMGLSRCATLTRQRGAPIFST